VAKNNSEWFKLREVASKVWTIHDNTQVASYLVEGKDKSILIDTGWGIGNLKELVQSITQLPVMVVFTHGHPDHVCGAFQFSDLYISKDDKNLLKSFYNKETRTKIIDYSLKGPYPLGFSKEEWINAQIDNVSPIQDGDIFDIGERELKVIAVPGHTAGSLCLLDEEEGLLFSGDSVQATPVLIHLDTSLSLTTYFNSLTYLYSLKDEYSTIFPSHGETPVNNTVLEDLFNGVSDVLEGKIRGKLEQTRFGEGLYSKFNTSGIIYNENCL